MVDFKKKLGKAQIDKKIDPLDIYNSLDRRSITGPLRPAQNQILQSWFTEYQNNRDLIVKLHTGEGKTLIGLLILLSKVNQKQGACLYATIRRKPTPSSIQLSYGAIMHSKPICFKNQFKTVFISYVRFTW